MAVRTTSPSNPLARTASSISASSLAAIEIAARLAGSALVLLYAWTQYSDFDRYFGRTWIFTIFVAAIAIATMVPAPGWPGRAWRAIGPGALIFGGAMLAREIEGGLTLLCGIAAWLAVAAAESRARGGVTASTVGLALAAALTFAVAISTALIAE